MLVHDVSLFLGATLSFPLAHCYFRGRDVICMWNQYDVTLHISLCLICLKSSSVRLMAYIYFIMVRCSPCIF